MKQAKETGGVIGSSDTKTIITVTGIVYRFYFESMQERAMDGKIMSCMVVANNIDEAIAKVHVAYPGEAINSIYCDRTFSSGPARPEVVIL